MAVQGPLLVGRGAGTLAELVRRRTVSPRQVVQAHLDQVVALDGRIGAFQIVRGVRALVEAGALEARGDLAALPLAGVPVAIKDNVPIAGEPMRCGSAGTPPHASSTDHEVVSRLRAAGAVVLGSTRVPELCAWGTTDGAYGATHNPWDVHRTPGGSSGGSAAAVAAAMVPLALGNDALGSIRIPAACCGVVGIKPGVGVVPSNLGVSSWFGTGENGPLATTADDAALMLSVLAHRPDLREPRGPNRPLRIAVSIQAPLVGVTVAREWKAVTLETGKLLEGANHDVVLADPPYSTKYALAIMARWFAGVAQDAEALNYRKLERRTRGHVQAGRLAQRLRLVKPAHREAWRQIVESFFSRFDLLVTPALAATPLRAEPWSQRSWFANLWANARYAPFGAPWNLAGYPAACVPAGLNSDGIPLAVQLVAAHGNESVILWVARELEQLRPWPRHAPIAGVSA